MQAWVEQARQSQWLDWSYEETIKAKLLLLDYLGLAFANCTAEENRRLAEHLEEFQGAEQATLFAGSVMIPAPLAALGNAMLTEAPLLFPVVLAAIEMQNKGGQELLTALIVGLEAMYRMGDDPQAELLGALLGVANAFELDEDGWHVLLGQVLRHHAEVPTNGMARGLLAHDMVLSGSLARDEWSEQLVERSRLPETWLDALRRTSDKPGLVDFLMAREVNADQVIASFTERATGKIPAAHLHYYLDAVMGMEDVCCVPLFFRK